jgi:hypothetical protein
VRGIVPEPRKRICVALRVGTLAVVRFYGLEWFIDIGMEYPGGPHPDVLIGWKLTGADKAGLPGAIA